MNLKRFTGGKESRCYARICSVDLLEMRVESEERLPQKVCYRAEDELEGWTWRSGERGEELHIAHLLSCEEWPVGPGNACLSWGLG